MGDKKTEAQKKAQKAYMDKYVEVKVRMTPSERQTIQKHATLKSESTTAFIKRAINQTMNHDNQSNE